AGGVGPALTRISDTFPPAQLAALLKAPNAGMKSGGMSALTLDAADMTALVSYLGSLSGGATAAASSPASSSSVALTPGSASSTPAGATPAESSSSSSAGTSSGAPAALAAVASVTSSKGMLGGRLYQSDGCAACHGESGKGTQRAPAFAGIGNRLSAAQLTSLLHTPTAAMTAGGMPHVPGSESDIANLVAYLRSLKSSVATPHQTANPTLAEPPANTSQPTPKPTTPTTPTTATPATESAQPQVQSQSGAGNPSASGQTGVSSTGRGEAIFNAGGCAACHGVGGIGTQAAPALEKISKTLTPAALASLLEHPNPKMRAGGMPATDIDAADMDALVAYLQNLGSVHAAAPATHAAPSGPPATRAPQTGSIKSSIDAQSSPLNQLAVDGQLIFEAHSCGTCHGMHGVGGTWAAPALANTGKNFPPALLVTLFQHPTVRMQTGGMPVVSLSPAELQALAAYVSAISSAKPPPNPVPR
ncbi:MAG: c-type cytochrome, partial [Gemmatimonadaceae bacterium]